MVHRPCGPVCQQSITQGTLLRLLINLAKLQPPEAADVLARLQAHPRHVFWPCDIGYQAVGWHGVTGPRQVTDAYLAALTRHHGGKLATFDHGLAALHADVAVALD